MLQFCSCFVDRFLCFEPNFHSVYGTYVDFGRRLVLVLRPTQCVKSVGRITPNPGSEGRPSNISSVRIFTETASRVYLRSRTFRVLSLFSARGGSVDVSIAYDQILGALGGAVHHGGEGEAVRPALGEAGGSRCTGEHGFSCCCCCYAVSASLRVMTVLLLAVLCSSAVASQCSCGVDVLVDAGRRVSRFLSRADLEALPQPAAAL